MAYIIIAYTTKEVDGQTVRIYDDSTEKYFEDIASNDARKYFSYLTNKGLTVDSSEVNILQDGDFNVDELIKQDALAKLSQLEKDALGIGQEPVQE